MLDVILSVRHDMRIRRIHSNRRDAECTFKACSREHQLTRPCRLPDSPGMFGQMALSSDDESSRKDRRRTPDTNGITARCKGGKIQLDGRRSCRQCERTHTHSLTIDDFDRFRRIVTVTRSIDGVGCDVSRVARSSSSWTDCHPVRH